MPLGLPFAFILEFRDRRELCLLETARPPGRNHKVRFRTDIQALGFSLWNQEGRGFLPHLLRVRVLEWQWSTLEKPTLYLEVGESQREGIKVGTPARRLNHHHHHHHH